MSDFKAKLHQNTKFGCDSALDPARGAYSAPQTPKLDVRDLLLSGAEWSGWEGTGGQGRGVLWSP